MAVKAVEMVRKIRDKQFEETRGLSVQVGWVEERNPTKQTWIIRFCSWKEV